MLPTAIYDLHAIWLTLPDGQSQKMAQFTLTAPQFTTSGVVLRFRS
jgi:hypothetical protein